MRVGVADLPLHHGKCPRWLFARMVKLGRLIYLVIERDYGRDEFLKRIVDPIWFQAFGCVLGFDWHSSGVTTTVCGALKEGLKPEDGLVVLGGKGKVSRETPNEIEKAGEVWNFSDSKIKELVYASRMSAKIDNSVLQDGYTLYHHSFFVTEDGRWAVIQQGMNERNNYARRYHWIDEKVESFVNEPHLGICCDRIEEKVLNMVAAESENARKVSVEIAKDKDNVRILREMQTTLVQYGLKMPKEHNINVGLYKKFVDLSEFSPRNYEELVSLRGVGPKTIRALALLSELVYGEKPSWRDPVKYSFAHGGKDGTPFPVDKTIYDESIEILKNAVEEAKLGDYEKLAAIKRLKNYLKE